MTTERNDDLFNLWPGLSSEEAARRIYSDPDLFAECHPDELEALKQTNVRLMEQEPMQYVEFIDNWAKELPVYYEVALSQKEQFFKEEQLRVLSDSLQTMLYPPRPFPHPAIEKKVKKYEPLYMKYLELVASQLIALEISSDDQGENDKRPATATLGAMYVYLERAGYFKAVKKITKELREVEAVKRECNPTSLATDYTAFKKKREKGGLGKADVTRIEKVIDLLQKDPDSLEAAISYAQGDLQKLKTTLQT